MRGYGYEGNKRLVKRIRQANGNDKRRHNGGAERLEAVTPAIGRKSINLSQNGADYSAPAWTCNVPVAAVRLNPREGHQLFLLLFLRMAQFGHAGLV